MTISTHAVLTISLADSDVGVNIDQIVLGNEDLGLPPDIWNLPPLPVANGQFQADWKALSRTYTAPEWWRPGVSGEQIVAIRRLGALGSAINA